MRCTTPNCVCQNHSTVVCSKPNPWHVFRRVNKSRFNQRTMSHEYKKTKDNLSPDELCIMASTLGLNVCNSFEKQTDPSTHDVCSTLISDIQQTSHHRSTTKMWDWVLRILHGGARRFPDEASKYTQSQLNYIASVVANAFYSPVFLSHLRSKHGWEIEMVRESRNTGPTDGAGATGRRGGIRFHTVIEGPLIDRWFDGKRTIYNDGFLIKSRLEWVAHVVAHELLHCLLICVCGHSASVNGGHDTDFVEMNKVLLGGHGYTWDYR
jgi:hypothetical protein